MNIYELQATLTLDTGPFRQSAEEAAALFRSLGEEIGAAAGAMADNTAGIADAFGSLMASALSGTEELSALSGMTEALFAPFDEGLADRIGNAAAGFGALTSALTDSAGAGNAVAGIFGETIPAAVGSALSAIASLPGEFASIGSAMASGLESGFSAIWDGVVGAIGRKVAGLVDSIKDKLGIRSPSLVFAGIGENMAQGVLTGWDAAFPEVLRETGGDLSSLARGRALSRSAFPVDRIGYEASAVGLSSAAGITSLMTAGSFGADRDRPIEIRLTLDGDVAAEALVDPLKRCVLRRDAAEGGFFRA